MENTIESAKAFLKQNEVYSEYHVVCDKLPEESKQVSGLLVAYAKSVRPEVVVPSDELICEMICGMVFIRGVDLDNYIDEFKNDRSGLYDSLLSELRRLNPTLTFTELNHTAPTGDKSDEG
jgi:hypothetical protein